MNFGDPLPMGLLLHRINTRLRIEVTTTVLDPLGLAFPEYICMRILSHNPGRSNADLARDVNVSPQAMNMVLRELQKRGLVSRPASVASGRSLPAELTRAGVDLLDRTTAGIRAAEDRLMAGMTTDDQNDFRRMLAVVAQLDGAAAPTGTTQPP
jgi:DNA-binding MarR family transcriptional regulator